MSSSAVRKEDVVGISSLSFSNTGNGIYLSSSSELQQISLSARHTVAAGGGRVEVERRDEEEGGEGDTDSQADRWVSIHRHHLTQLTTLPGLPPVSVIPIFLSVTDFFAQKGGKLDVFR